MDWSQIYLDTFIPELPKYWNDNFASFKRYLDVFYDGNRGILIKPLETTGRVKGSRGEFVTAVVDNLVVKNQFTNLYGNITTADDSYYTMLLDPPIVPRDPCTFGVDTSVWKFPYENPSYKVIDVNKPYYKLSNEYPVQLYNLNLSQIVGFYLDPSLIGSSDFEILIDPCVGTSFLADPSLAGQYIEFIAESFDASWGSTWLQYKPATALSSGGGGGTGIYEPTLADTLAVPSTVGGITAGTTVGDLRGSTFTELWDDLLFPTVLASVDTNHSVTLSGISTTTVEVGTSYAPSTSGIFNPGSIDNGDGTAGPNLVGDANEFTFRLPGGTIDGTYTASGNTQSHSFSAHSIAFGSNVWQVQADYDAGAGVYYDNKGNPGSNLNVLRNSGTDVNNSPAVTGRRYAWYGSGGTAPSSSAGVRALTSKIFLSASNTGIFNISIPSSTATVYFYIPAGKTVLVQYVQSSLADVTSSFATSAISVDDAGGTSQSYESWTTIIGGGGYPAAATYRVTIS